MTKDLRRVYRIDLTEHFPPELRVQLGEVELVYEKVFFDLPGENGRQTRSGLRYGENPDQEAALYRLVNGHLALAKLKFVGPEDGKLISALGSAEAPIFGSRKHPSKTNLTDVDSALAVLKWLAPAPAATVIVKHNNPSGAALGATPAEAFHRAYEADRVAAFGGAAVFNQPLDRTAAGLIGQRFLEVVAAPDFEEGVLELLLKKPDLRLFRIDGLARLAAWRPLRFLDIKSLIDGGLILQHSPINRILTPEDFLPAQAGQGEQALESARRPTEAEYRDLIFGWAVEQGVTSNSVLFVKDGATVGLGCGQQDRVGVVEIAAFKARRNYAESLAFARCALSLGELELAAASGGRAHDDLLEIRHQVEVDRGNLAGSSMVSDAFFPFRDAVDRAIEQKVSAIAHPGGALRDRDSIEACNQAGVAMVFTGQRAFKH
ncbi:MAG: IMP cyclohydrolase [Deltaproteobacteria bacterium]|jgi:phosphoribosylaminoimidazolecarboxamide formyltransferase/IMP cyclohydrolase|nr:IMP cyclohydrolase [Deltaproteobacteria bacterium]